MQVQYLDDIDGSEAAETLRYGLDGASYEIDLNAEHAEKLRAALARFILKSRRIGRANPVPSRVRVATTPARVDRAQNQAVRDWARSKGIEVSDRGRIPRNVIDQYDAEAGR